MTKKDRRILGTLLFISGVSCLLIGWAFSDYWKLVEDVYATQFISPIP